MEASCRLRIVRRIDSPPEEERCTTGRTCPAVFVLSEGDLIAIIGTPPKAMISQRRLPSGKTLVVIPRHTLLSALESLDRAA
ncbi:hypothetical protein STRCI_006021 [Streptomyces cinnabarinus]|uniref:RCK C-terminal domain-containing protein n=1 Tax=Streptomyces cinnabarinus TaxID=67287 RepID=A0ABY7KJ72_9ACTN|nr:hypothetical protein [Streptomyces cinnabarinus]WAZ24584.1 hypothetical protein STRCI_006021 [Streptomyces cinnabarinus]